MRNLKNFLKCLAWTILWNIFWLNVILGRRHLSGQVCLFMPHLKEMERLAFQGQSAACMGIVLSLYEQCVLASLLQELRQENPNLDAATQTVRDIFAMSSKILDQLGHKGAYDHFIRWKATILDMGDDSIKDVAKHADYLPLTGDGVLGKEFETKLKERKEKNKEFKDLVPEIKQDSLPLKRKSNYPTNARDQKQSRFDNGRNNRSFSQNRSEYSTQLRYRNDYKSTSGSYGQKFQSHQKKGVSSFCAKQSNKWLKNKERTVSRDTSRGSSQIFHRSMETNHRRQTGSINHSKRIQTGVSKLASFLGNQRNSCQCQKSWYFNFGSKKFPRKSSDRTCTFCRPSPRFLQYLLFSSKKIGSIPSSDKSETPQPVSQNTTFQDGYYEDSSKSSKERRLGFICRPKRCIFSNLNSSKSQEVSKVLHKRESLSVPSLSFRSKNFSKGLHKGRSCSSSSSEDAEHQTSSVFRRLVSPKCNQTSASQRQREF